MSAHDERIDADPYGILPELQAGKVKVLRQSTIGTADTCLHRLEYDLDPAIPYGTGEARAVGTGYHAGNEHYYRGRMLEQLPVEMTTDTVEFRDILQAGFDAFELESEHDGFEWIEGKDAAFGKIETMLRAYFAGEHYWPASYKIRGVEYTFLMPLFGHWVTKGTLDLLVEDPNEWIIPVDHKSAKKPWKKGKESHRNQNQPGWYTSWLPHLLPDDKIADLFAFDVMTYAGAFERRVVDVFPHHRIGVLEKAKTLCELIDQGGPFPPNVSSFLCDARWCDHWNRCPFGAAFDAPVSVRSEHGT